MDRKIVSDICPEGGLVRIDDLRTHVFKSDFGKVAVMCCHDLNIFSNRGSNNIGEERMGIKDDFRGLLREESPRYVLQVPHTTDSHRIWYNAWKGMERHLPSVAGYAGAGRYYREGGERESLDVVLANTKNTGALDFIAAIGRS